MLGSQVQTRVIYALCLFINTQYVMEIYKLSKDEDFCNLGTILFKFRKVVM